MNPRLLSPHRLPVFRHRHSSQAAIVKTDTEGVCCTRGAGARTRGRTHTCIQTDGEAGGGANDTEQSSGDKDRHPPGRGRAKAGKETGGEAGREEGILVRKRPGKKTEAQGRDAERKTLVTQRRRGFPEAQATAEKQAT